MKINEVVKKVCLKFLYKLKYIKIAGKQSKIIFLNLKYILQTHVYIYIYMQKEKIM